MERGERKRQEETWKPKPSHRRGAVRKDTGLAGWLAGVRAQAGQDTGLENRGYGSSWAELLSQNLNLN